MRRGEAAAREPVGFGAALAPRGRSGRPPRRRRSLCLQPPGRPGSRGASSRGEPGAGGGKRPEEPGEGAAVRASLRRAWGRRLKVRRGVSSRGGVVRSRRPVSHRAVGGSPGRKPGGQRAERWTAKVLGAAAERSEPLVMEKLGRPEKSGGIRGRGEASPHSKAFPP